MDIDAAALTPSQREQIFFLAKVRADGEMTAEQFDAARKDILAEA